MSDGDDVQVRWRINRDVHDKLKALAEAEERTINVQVNRMLRKMFFPVRRAVDGARDS